MARTFNPNIVLFNTTIADLPLKTGYSQCRWQEGLNVMLEKTSGNFNVEKLQIILLFEADFNSNNKLLGQAVMLMAKSLDLLEDEQYGSATTRQQYFNASTKVCFTT